ncbi:MAG: DNA repair protein RecN [Nitrospinaceae bacterium]
MLKELKINHFAVIENLRVAFSPGLNVLTGETGAGKSIIVDALNLVLGGRADTDYIRTGKTAATVEAVFHVADPALQQAIRDLGLEMEDSDIIIKRTVSHAGKSRCFLNDGSITVSTLAKIGNRLVDIHGQHDHQALLRPETHVDLLDLYGKTMDARGQFSGEHVQYQKDLARLASMRAKEQDRRQREELLNFQLAEIGRAGLTAGEEEDLQREKKKLRHAEKLRQVLEQTQHLLSEAEGSALERLGCAARELESLVEIDPLLEQQVKRANNAYYEIQELVEELRGQINSIEFNPPRLEEIEDRLVEINGLKRKYGNDIASIFARRDEMAKELESLTSNQEKMEALQGELKVREKNLARLAASLAEGREKAARELKESVEKELRLLSMPHVWFGVRFDYQEDPEGFVTFRGRKVRLYPTGLGTIEFLFSPNPGEDLKPLAKIASGGELSRVMLGLKSILNEQDPIPVMIFDEVDTGIGGGVAERVGARLRKVAAGKQVFCITHLPQIAGLASAHFLVEKKVKGERTHSTLRKLSHTERVEEVARMAGGEKITPAARKHAEEMIRPPK